MKENFAGYSADADRAEALARARHAGQKDKAGQPYAGHLERVAARVQEPQLKTIAWLHDSMEDTGLSREEIAAEFGPLTAEAVALLTRREGEDYLAYAARVKENEAARAVKIADLIDNSNLTRLPQVTLQDAERQRRYNEALRLLLE